MKTEFISSAEASKITKEANLVKEEERFNSLLREINESIRKTALAGNCSYGTRLGYIPRSSLEKLISTLKEKGYNVKQNNIDLYIDWL